MILRTVVGGALLIALAVAGAASAQASEPPNLVNVNPSETEAYWTADRLAGRPQAPGCTFSTFADGRPFTDEDLRDGSRHVMVFFRGRW